MKSQPWQSLDKSDIYPPLATTRLSTSITSRYTLLLSSITLSLKKDFIKTHHAILISAAPQIKKIFIQIPRYPHFPAPPTDTHISPRQLTHISPNHLEQTKISQLWQYKSFSQYSGQSKAQEVLANMQMHASMTIFPLCAAILSRAANARERENWVAAAAPHAYIYILGLAVRN